MTRFQIANALYIAGLAYIVIMENYINVGFQVYLLFGISYILMLFFGVVFTQLNLFVDHELAGDARYNEIALSFDDGPNPESTEKVLSKLSRYGVKATFFIIGKNAEKHPELVEKIVEAGHIVGNHSYHHSKKFDFIKTKEIVAEIEKANTVIQNIIGKKPLYFRPPFGITHPRIARAIRQTKMKPVAWSLRTYDTTRSKEKVIKLLKKKLNGGDIILLHDNHKEVLDILDFVIPFAEESGFKFVNIDQLLNIKAYGIPQESFK
jgi:peptidoglycan/xylan/chitin deacetylase (PgdA/CDA1 family)